VLYIPIVQVYQNEVLTQRWVNLSG